MVMSQGRKVAEFDTKDATEEKIMFAATGGKCD
jgi:ABC-type sugar transport system ATPase subunit